MTEDRFEQIKPGWSGAGYTDVDWLIKEVERLRKANELMCETLILVKNREGLNERSMLNPTYEKTIGWIALETLCKVNEVMSE